MMPETSRFDAKRVKRFCESVFVACGSPADEATLISEHLVSANLMGFDSHGIIRICQYLADVKKGRIVPGAPVTIASETDNTALLDCGWNFGQVGGFRALQRAIEKAQTHHISMVVTRRCGHAGRLGAYTQAAAEQGFIALGFCNSPPGDGHFVVPWGGREGRLSTNPISFAIPCGNEVPILSDFSTAQTPEGKLRLYLNQKKPLPPGWIVDAQGNPSTDPADFYGPPRGAILPFGGELGYRGFALGLLVEALGGLLAGTSAVKPLPGNGLGLIVIKVSAFLPQAEFAALTEELRTYVKSCPPSAGHQEVMLPGEPDFRVFDDRTINGIPVDEQTWEQICRCTEPIGVRWSEGAADSGSREPAGS
ncbi:MAG: Ldh family oxidoreductase [Acidobacteria bacterium]|nr:Ldh family oxidoreductase [Acidobacteriota bacterium]